MSLISGHSQIQSAYEPTLWAKLFHSVPHVNITFHPVNSAFDKDNDLYLESLGILASIPAAWLITTLVILLIYLCTRCCDTKNNKKRKSRPIRCCLSFFSLITCTALSLGFLGNHYLHVGMEDFGKATMNINDIVERSQDMADKFNRAFMDGIDRNLNRLYDGPFQRDIKQDRAAHFEIMDNCDVIFHNITTGLNSMDGLRDAIDRRDADGREMRLQFQYAPYYAAALEKYRWPATMVVQALFALFCLLLFVGAIVHTRCVLILFSVCGLFSIILLWLLASVYTGTAVALADFCYDPTPSVQKALKADFGQMTDDVADFYLRCSPGKANPFESYLSKSQRAISDIDYRLRQISGSARKYYSPPELSPTLDELEDHTEQTMRLVNDLSMSLRCEPIFRSYNTALVALCDNGLFGLLLMLVSVAFSGFLFTILVWCNSHTWIYFKYKGRYIKVDDQDPYMPLSTIERPRMTPGAGPGSTLSTSAGAYGHHAHHPGAAAAAAHHRRHIHTPPQTPPYHGTLNGHGTLQQQQQQPQQQQRLPQVSAVSASSGGIPPGYGTTQHPHLGPMVHGGGGGSRGNVLGTLGRNTQAPSSHGGYQGMDNLPATMTLGRRGHYASLRTRAPQGAGGPDEAPFLGPNSGQYATLSKQCKTLESSDFY